ncbi:MAG: hypothetical protein ABIV48_04510 [Pyrinomonadaceae bacterium]
MQNDPKNLKQYLLGNLSEDKIGEIDQRLIEDDSLAEDLGLAETELIEEFIEGGLSNEDLQFFHSNFLISPKRVAMIREISSLRVYARSQNVQKKRPDWPEGVFVKTAAMFRVYLSPITIAAGILAVVFVGVTLWSVLSRGSGISREAEIATLNKVDLNDISKIGHYSTINLISGGLRGGDSANRYDSSLLTETILFRLAFPSQVGNGTLYMARIFRDGQFQSSIDGVSLYQNRSGRELRLLLPKSSLVGGEYRLEISDPSGTDLMAYSFVID